MLARGFAFEVDDAAVADEVRRAAKRWWILVALGVAAAVVGVILLLNPFTAVSTLALLVAIGLIVDGIGEMLNARRFRHPVLAIVIGAVWIAAGVLALAWPGITLWVLAVVTGASFVIGGLIQTIAAVVDHEEIPLWGLWAVLGVIGMIVGVLALAWPGATVVVLALLLGIRLVVSGVVAIAAGLALRRLAATV